VSLSAGGGSHSPRPRAAETVFSHHYNKKAGGNGKLLLSVRNNLSFRSLQGNCPAVMATNMAADKKKKKRRSSTSGSLGAEEEEVEAEVVTVATKEKTADGRGKVFEDEEQRKMDGENGEDSEKGKRNGEAQKLSSSEEEVEAEEHDPPVLGHQLEHTRKGVEPEAVVHSLQKGRAPKRHSSRRLQRRGLLLLSDSIMRRASVPVPSVNSHQWKEATEQCRRKLTSVGVIIFVYYLFLPRSFTINLKIQKIKS
jgi:hypothetical protein